MDDNNAKQQSSSWGANPRTKWYNLGMVILFLAYESLWSVVLLNLWFGFGEGIELNSDYDKFAITIIVIWVMLIIPYLAWLIYFYNINWGLTDADWAKIDKHQGEQVGGFYNSHAQSPLHPIAVPQRNPYIHETMGIPRGNIRGILALTVSLGGFALMISAMGKDSTLASNQFFVDNLEFFKTAFLMVMAFYFGTKGLEILRSDYQGPVYGNPVSNPESPLVINDDSVGDGPQNWANEEFSEEEKAVG